MLLINPRPSGIHTVIGPSQSIAAAKVPPEKGRGLVAEGEDV
jgi:hypothetical protein